MPACHAAFFITGARKFGSQMENVPGPADADAQV